VDGPDTDDTLLKSIDALSAFMNAWFDAGAEAAKKSSLVLLDCLTAPLFDEPSDVIKNAQQRYADLAGAWATFFKTVGDSLVPGGTPGGGPGAAPDGDGPPGQVMRAGRTGSISLPLDFPPDAAYPLSLDAEATLGYGPNKLALAVMPSEVPNAGNAWITLEAAIPEGQQQGWYQGTLGYTASDGQRGNLPLRVGVLPAL
jgi:hypothetical protein